MTGLTRRQLLVGAAGAASLLAGCGTAPATADTPATAAPGFPVTIEHARGSTTISAAPARVVSVGYTDHEPLLALGVVPVGVVSWFGRDVDATWPWVSGRWGTTTPTYINDESGDLMFEKIAELQPDLIIGLYADLDATTYTKLSAIAPTVAQSTTGAAYTTSWTEMTRTAAQAVGQAAAGETLIADIEAKFAAARAAHPEFATQTAAVVDPGYGSIYPFSSKDPRGVFMTSLGYQPAAKLDAFIGDKFGTDLSSERLDLLEVDRLLLLADAATQKELAANKLFQQLDVVSQGRALEITYQEAPSVGAAIAYNSVLSIPYAIEGIVPQLAS